MTTHVNDGGTWRQLTEVHVNDGGTWRRIQNIYVNDSGTWREVFTGDLITLSPTTVTDIDPSGTAVANYRLNADGFVYQTQGDALVQQYAWITPQINMALYECVWTVNTNVVDSTPGSAGVGLALNVDRIWSESNNAPGIENAIFNLSIRRIADGFVMAGPVQIELQAEIIV